MKSKTAKAIDIRANLGHSKCTVQGSYIPSTLIGTACAKQLALKQPLLTTITSPRATTGQFKLEIALPSDIKDDDSKVHVVHDSWGILISFPRRKIIHEAEVKLVSCFGVTHLGAPRQDKTPTTIRQLHIPASSTTPPPPTSSASSLDPVQDTAIPSTDPQILLGRAINLPGAKWGPQYKGHTYTGIIDSFIQDGDYGYWEAKFDDCRERFDITDLLKYELVSQLEYDQLKRTCYPEDAQAEHVPTE